VHVVACALVVAWLVLVCEMSLAVYLACFAYPGLALTLVRSFAEHRPAEAVGHRSAIVEAGPLMSLLFLNNNLHFVHHSAPSLPWYELPARYRAHRAAVLDRNGGYRFDGYLAIARAHLLCGKGSPVHPRKTASTRAQSSPITRSSVVTGTTARTAS
jgi:fatty acid desaturase